MNQRFVSLKTRAGQTTANDVALLGGLYSDVLSAPRMSREVADANRFDAGECHCVVVFNGASGDANCAHQNASLIHYGETAREGDEPLVRMLDSKQRGARL